MDALAREFGWFVEEIVWCVVGVEVVEGWLAGVLFDFACCGCYGQIEGFIVIRLAETPCASREGCYRRPRDGAVPCSRPCWPPP